MPKTAASINKDWELPEDLGQKAGVNHNNYGLVMVALLMDIREELRIQSRAWEDVQKRGVAGLDMISEAAVHLDIPPDVSHVPGHLTPQQKEAMRKAARRVR